MSLSRLGEEKAFLKFKNYIKKMRVPFVIYADLVM